MSFKLDPLFKGCTRPAMYLGVPIVPLSLVAGSILLLSVWTYLAISLLLIPAILIMRLITKEDDQQFRLLWLRFYCRSKNKNRTFWQATTYSPVTFKKRGK